MSTNKHLKIKEVLGKHAVSLVLGGMLGVASFTYFLYDQVSHNSDVNLHQQITLDKRASNAELIEHYIKSVKLQEDMLKQLCGKECEHLYQNKSDEYGGE